MLTENQAACPGPTGQAPLTVPQLLLPAMKYRHPTPQEQPQAWSRCPKLNWAAPFCQTSPKGCGTAPQPSTGLRAFCMGIAITDHHDLQCALQLLKHVAITHAQNSSSCHTAGKRWS